MEHKNQKQGHNQNNIKNKKNDIHKEWKRTSYVNAINKIQPISSIKDVQKLNASINKESKKEIIDPNYIPIWKKKRHKVCLLNESIIMTIITKEQNLHFSNLLNFIKIQHPYILIEHLPDYSIKLKNLHINYTLTIVYQPIKWFMITHIENVHNIFNMISHSKNYYDTYKMIFDFIHK